MYSPRWLGVVGAAVLLFPLAPGFARNQEPAPTPPPPADQPQAPAANPTPPAAVSSSSRKKSSHASDFLILGTAFTDKALALPGAQLRVRRAAEKKFRWETYTNSRGEFAVRVPQGLQYEVVIAAKGFAVQTHPIDARSGISEDHLVFRMEPVAGGKK